jgi:hypothetical protein
VAEKTLVTQEDLADGARLIQQLDQAGFPITAAFWAYDPILEQWRLIIAAPRESIESLVRAYGIIQDAIIKNDLRVTLDRISLIPDDHSKLKNLHDLAKSDAPDVIEASVGGTEIAGRVFDDIHLYRSDALKYERQVTQALQRMQSQDSVLRTNYISPSPRRLEFDALIDDGDRLIIVEIKMRSKPLSARDITNVAEMAAASIRNFRRSVATIIVSPRGFTVNAQAEAQRYNVKLVQWAGPQDDENLQRALSDIRAG